MNAMFHVAERGLLPDAAIRFGIRRLLRRRLDVSGWRPLAPPRQPATGRIS